MTTESSTDEALESSLLADLIDRVGPVAVMASVRDERSHIVDFRYVVVNEAFARTLHEPVDVLVGSRLLELYPSHVELGLFDAYRRVVETGEPYVSELPWFDERNVRAFLEVHVTRFHDGYLITGRDITESRTAAPAELMARVLAGATPPTSPVTRVRRDGTAGRVHVGSLPTRREPVGPTPPEHGTSAVRWLRTTTDEVEVWSGFSRRWIAGFAVTGVREDGSVMVRRADGVSLPEAIDPDLVRPVVRGMTSEW